MTDTGPPYPPLPASGSNAIGVLGIGESQLGDISPFDWFASVTSQFANSPILTGIIQSFFEASDQTANLDAFYDNIWNLDTAQGYGLDVWGRIVGVDRVLEISIGGWFGFAEALPGSLSWNSAGTYIVQPYLGFAEALPPATSQQIVQSFNNGTFGLNETFVSNTTPIGGAFYSGTGLTTSYSLSDQSYRFLIYAKAAANITDGSIPAINQILLNLFPNRGNCYVAEGVPNAHYFGFAESGNASSFGQDAFYNGEVALTMCMTYVFEFPLSAVELAIVEQSGVLPKPVGVQVSISVTSI